MSTETSITGPDRPAGTFLGAAVGDALGWPQENRSRIVGGNSARQVEPAPRFRDWVRNGGTRFATYKDPVRAGEYSDDTQLLMAVARSCLRGHQWWQWFATVEMPQWPLYQRGGGGAVLRAARAWTKGRPPWIAQDAKEISAAQRYFDAGGNGVAMRIAPHAILGTRWGDSTEMTRRIVRDGLITHGHPHALIGAVIHGQTLFHALSKSGTLEYGELLDRLLDEPTWADPDLLMDAADSVWHDGYRAAFKNAAGAGPNAAQAWHVAAEETLTSLTRARQALERGTLVNDHDTLDAIGCFDDRRSGAGTVAAVAAAYVVSRSASRPMNGLLRTAFLHGADTDTIASMTGSILGALHGTRWMESLGEDVQDRDYLLDLSSQLTKLPSEYRPSHEANPDSDTDLGLRVAWDADMKPVHHLTEGSLRRFTATLLDAEDPLPAQLPDTRFFFIKERIPLEAKGRSYVTRVLGQVEDGQTIFLDRVTRTKPEHIKQGDDSTQGDHFDKNIGVHAESSPDKAVPGQIASVVITRMELRVADLETSARFYGDFLGLRLQRGRGQLRLENGLLLSQVRAVAAGAQGTRGFVLTIAHPAPDLLAKSAIEHHAQAAWSDNGSTLWLKDPDGNSIRVLQTDPN